MRMVGCRIGICRGWGMSDTCTYIEVHAIGVLSEEPLLTGKMVGGEMFNSIFG